MSNIFSEIEEVADIDLLDCNEIKELYKDWEIIDYKQHFDPQNSRRGCRLISLRVQ